MSKIILKCGKEWLKAENLKILRKVTNLSYLDICERINNNKPVVEFLLFFNDYEEIEQLLKSLIDNAEKKQLAFEIYEIGEDEIFSTVKNVESFKITLQMLRNIFESSKETIRHLQAEDEAKFS